MASILASLSACILTASRFGGGGSGFLGSFALRDGGFGLETSLLSSTLFFYAPHCSFGV